MVSVRRRKGCFWCCGKHRASWALRDHVHGCTTRQNDIDATVNYSWRNKSPQRRAEEKLIYWTWKQGRLQTEGGILKSINGMREGESQHVKWGWQWTSVYFQLSQSLQEIRKHLGYIHDAHRVTWMKCKCTRTAVLGNEYLDGIVSSSCSPLSSYWRIIGTQQMLIEWTNEQVRSMRWLELCKMVNRKAAIADREHGGQRHGREGRRTDSGGGWEWQKHFVGERTLKVVRMKK